MPYYRDDAIYTEGEKKLQKAIHDLLTEGMNRGRLEYLCVRFMMSFFVCKTDLVQDVARKKLYLNKARFLVILKIMDFKRLSKVDTNGDSKP